MSLRRALVSALAAICVLLAFAGAAAAASGDVSLTSDRSRITTQLGHNLVFRTRVANHASNTTGSLIAHLNVLSLRNGVEVDPEDWSTHRTRYLGTIPAGGSKTITWQVHAITTGRIALYVAVLPQAGVDTPPTTSPTVQLVVAERDTLNSGGILPLALGIPGLLGLMAGGARLARRRR
jgi:hypothetical protein